jgi:hypothetical protein
MLCNWKMLHPQMTEVQLGLIQFWLDEDNSAPAKDQLHHNYSHGGGWNPFKGFRLDETNSLHYSSDPPLRPLAETMLRNEKIVFYDHSWVAIIQPDRTFEVCRMD